MDTRVTAVEMNPMGVANLLVAKELIPLDSCSTMKSFSSDKDKARELMHLVTKKIKLGPRQWYEEFVAILAQESFLVEAREELTAVYKKVATEIAYPAQIFHHFVMS